MSRQNPDQPGLLRALYHELSHRGVVRVTWVYFVVAFGLIQAGDLLYEPLGMQKSPVRVIMIAALIGFPVAIACAWLFNIRRDKGEPVDGLTRQQSLMAMLGSAALGTIVLVMGGWLALRPASEPRPDDVRPTERQPDHIAVLYFQERSLSPVRDSSDSYLAGAITEALIDALSSQDSIKVISSNGVRQFQNTAVSPDSIARSLNVGTIVSGRVTTSPDSVFVTVDVIAPNGLIEHTKRVPAARGDPFPLVDMVVSQVGQFLRERIGVKLSDERWHRETENDSAWVLMQRAHALEREARNITKMQGPRAALPTLVAADSFAAQAERMDANYAHATIFRAWLAWGRAFAAYDLTRKNILPTREALDAGFRHASRALTRHPNDPQALEVRGALAILELDLLSGEPAERDRLQRQAEADLRTASLRDPGRARAMSNLSNLLESRGNPTEAATFAQQAYAADAWLEDHNILNRLFEHAFEAGDDANAKRWCDEMVRRDMKQLPAAFCTVKLLAVEPPTRDARSMSPITAAWAAFARVDVPAPMRAHYKPHMDMMVAEVIVKAGLPDSARAVASRAIAAGNGDPDLLLLEAQVRLQLKEADRARQLIQQFEAARPKMRGRIVERRAFASLR